MKLIKNSITFLWQHLKYYKWQLLWQAFCSFFSGFSTIGAVIALQVAMNAITNDNLLLTTIICGTILGLYFFNWFLQYSQFCVNSKMSQKISKKIRSDLFVRLNKLPISYFDKNTTGDIMSRFINDVNNISIFLSDNFADLLGLLIWLFGIGIAIFILSWSLSLITIVLFIFSVTFVWLKIKKSIPYFEKVQATIGEFTGLLEEKIAGQFVIDLYEKQADVKKEFDQVHEKLMNYWEEAQLKSFFTYPLVDLLVNSITIIISAIAVLFVIYDVHFMNINISTGSSDATAIASLTIYILLVRNFLNALSQFPTIVNVWLGTNVGIERVQEVLKEQDEFTSTEKLAILISMDKYNLQIKNAEDFPNVKALKPEIEFKHVGFGYSKNEQVLKDVSFKIKSGSFIGIVGPTGSGKTTVINLLNKLYDPTEGDILIDGVSLKEINRNHLRKNISTVLQDTFFFSLSIKDNIKLANPDASDEEIIRACKQAKCHEIISNLKHGYDTVISSSSSELSKGQKQLIAIARAIISNASLVIFDEATSSVDVKTEIQVQQAMETLLKNKTAILIAHRLSTVRNADQILVINKGALIESGNHDQLLKQKGFYSKLFHSQFDIID